MGERREGPPPPTTPPNSPTMTPKKGPRAPRAAARRRGPSPTRSTSTRYSSRCTPTPGSPPSHVHHELLHERHLREDRVRGLPPHPLHQEGHPLLPGDPDRRAPH